MWRCRCSAIRSISSTYSLLLIFKIYPNHPMVMWTIDGSYSLSSITQQIFDLHSQYPNDCRMLARGDLEPTSNSQSLHISKSLVTPSGAVICQSESDLRKSKTMPRSRLNIISPYGPRPRRSKQLIVLWMGVLLFVLVTAYYLITRRRETTETNAKILLHGDGSSPRRGSPKMQVVD